LTLAAAVHPVNQRLSKKVENHKAMIALHYMHYNFARIHKTAPGDASNGGRRERSGVGAGGDRPTRRVKGGAGRCKPLASYLWCS